MAAGTPIAITGPAGCCCGGDPCDVCGYPVVFTGPAGTEPVCTNYKVFLSGTGWAADSLPATVEAVLRVSGSNFPLTTPYSSGYASFFLETASCPRGNGCGPAPGYADPGYLRQQWTGKFQCAPAASGFRLVTPNAAAMIGCLTDYAGNPEPFDAYTFTESYIAVANCAAGTATGGDYPGGGVVFGPGERDAFNVFQGGVATSGPVCDAAGLVSQSWTLSYKYSTTGVLATWTITLVRV